MKRTVRMQQLSHQIVVHITRTALMSCILLCIQCHWTTLPNFNPFILKAWIHVGGSAFHQMFGVTKSSQSDNLRLNRNSFVTLNINSFGQIYTSIKSALIWRMNWMKNGKKKSVFVDWNPFYDFIPLNIIYNPYALESTHRITDESKIFIFHFDRKLAAVPLLSIGMWLLS